jgi:predicted RNase H-like HicB family nuclease
MTYAIVIEPTGTGYCSYVPDLPGCVGAAATLPELKVLMAEAIKGHIEFNRELGEEIPPPTTLVASVEVELDCVAQ